MPDFNQQVEAFERVFDAYIDKKGLTRTEHEFGIVVEDQTHPTEVLVQSLLHDGPPRSIPALTSQGGYKIGDKVLIQNLNSDTHNKLIIGGVGGAFYDSDDIDYSNLPDTPMRIYRQEMTFRDAPGCGDNSKRRRPTSAKCPERPRVYKIVYGEGKPEEWCEIYNRNSEGRIVSITTEWPPNNSIQFTEYVVRDPETGLMDYYGEDPEGRRINSMGRTPKY